ncbi:MAG: ABC transporter ATP-binding protein [Spirochaetales bacterium]|nr:MAG: ABC transporter ATP-binding protein [Spirochaetales bacterium]
MAYSITGLRKAYGEQIILDGIDLDFPSGSVSVVLGPSGCGKTTLLNIMAGLDKDYEGLLMGFADARPAYAFQEDRLLPWLSASENVAFVLQRFMDRSRRTVAAEEALADVGLLADANRLPAALSGGMRKRVALARAFAYPSDVLLMDEPFSALDLKTRIAVMDLFLELRRQSGRTAVLVTHDVREAIYLGDHVTTLSDKPSTIRDTINLNLPKEDRSYASVAAADIEARLYGSILA